MSPLIRQAMTSAAIVLAAVAMSGCDAAMSTGTITTSIAQTPGFVPGVPPGYQCPLVPNGFDPPGSIYRLDKNGTYYRVKDFSQDPAVMAMNGVKRDVPISNYVLTDKQTAAAGLSYEVLKSALPGLAVDGTADFKKDISVSILVEDMRGEVIDDQVADYIVKWVEDHVKPKPGSSYFIVREAVKAGAVSYSLKRDDVAKLGGAAQMEGLAKGNANVTFRDDGGLFEIKQKFSPDRINVCIKSAEIVLQNARSADGAKVSLKSPDDTTVPPIKKVGTN